MRNQETRILVVDDNRDGADMLAALLTCHGHQVEVAYDGLTASRRLAETKFDVALCDIGLPGRSGYDVARDARRVQAEILLIALSAYASPLVRQLCEEAGFDLFLAKPADPIAIERLMLRHRGEAEDVSTNHREGRNGGLVASLLH
jgi:CheY-like chemotaxis protein